MTGTHKIDESLAWHKRRYSRWTEILRLMVGILVHVPEHLGMLVPNAKKRGRRLTQEWFNALLAQQETEDGDPGSLGLLLVMSSLGEVAEQEDHTHRAVVSHKYAEKIVLSCLVRLLERHDPERDSRIIADFVESLGYVPEEILHVVVRQLLLALPANHVMATSLLTNLLTAHRARLCLQPFCEASASQCLLTRCVAIDLLGQYRDDPSREQLLAMLSDPTTEVRVAVIRALGQWGKHMPVERLYQCLDDPEDAVCQTAVSVLGELGEQELIHRLLPMLSTPRKSVRQVVAHILSTHAATLSLEQIEPCLCHPDADIRLAALFVLKGMGEHVSAQRWEQYLADASAEVRTVAIRVLAKRGLHAPLAYLERAFADSAIDMQTLAQHILQGLGPDVPWHWLSLLLKSPDADIREQVAYQLCQQIQQESLALPDRQVLLEQIQMLLHDENADMRWHGLTALHALDVPLTPCILLTILQGREQQTGEQEVHEPGKGKDEEQLLMIALLAAWKGGDSYKWNLATHILASLGEQAPTELLLTIVRDLEQRDVSGRIWSEVLTNRRWRDLRSAWLLMKRPWRRS